jgi:hypothetical protein
MQSGGFACLPDRKCTVLSGREFGVITYFCLRQMRYTPFNVQGDTIHEEFGQEILRQHRIFPSTDWRASDILLTDMYPLDASFYRRNPGASRKPVLVWTPEPRYCTVFAKLVEPLGEIPQVHIMNVYTGDLYLNNFSIFSWAIEAPKIDPSRLVTCSRTQVPQIVTISSFFDTDAAQTTLVRCGRDIDLYAFRQAIVFEARKSNCIDVFGRNWPKGISKEDSRGDGWHDRKIELLQPYRFNLCLENTTYDFYCSEKIWDAIRAGCLPIYFGKGNRIYDDFPEGSFVDAAQYATPTELLSHINNMGDREYRDRYTKCATVYNRFIDTSSFEAEYERSVRTTISRIESIL